ncbi:MAG: AAA family ATPase [Candidatus Micrarchaeota archaeon]|nr:AAA family ATPase [Candidatus Micrarchaeota archaeon]
MIITLSGSAGSGKSSIAKMLAKRLGFRHYSVGDAQREIAREMEINIVELGELEAKDDSLDRMIDEKQRKIGENEDNIVVDSWLAAHFIPNSVKIFLDADIGVRVRRRLEQERSEEDFREFDEAEKKMLQREKTNRERWLRYYGFDYSDKRNYDLVIDTSNMTKEQVVDKIIRFIERYEER